MVVACGCLRNTLKAADYCCGLLTTIPVSRAPAKGIPGWVVRPGWCDPFIPGWCDPIIPGWCDPFIMSKRQFSDGSLQYGSSESLLNSCAAVVSRLEHRNKRGGERRFQAEALAGIQTSLHEMNARGSMVL